MQLRPLMRSVLGAASVLWFFSTTASFATEPSAMVELRGTIMDADTLAPLAARLYIQSADGTWHFARSAAEHGSAVEYRKSNGTQSVEMHTALSAGPFVASLPRGRYTLTVERGKEYLPATATVDLGERPATVTLKLKRWVDMSRLGWYSGETHVHRLLGELPTAMLADDLNVTLPLTYWVVNSDTTPGRANHQQGPVAPRLIEVDSTHVIYPLNAEYEIFNTRGKQHMLGAVLALNLKRPLAGGVPPVRSVAEEVHRQGGLLDLDKHNWPWSMMIVPTMKVDLYELSNNHVWRTKFRFGDWALPAPAYMHVEQDGDRVTENGWIDFTMQNYYCLLDCGFRLRPTAGTASGVHPVPLGYGRVYVHLADKFSYGAWIHGLDAGQSFVTTGPLLDVRLDNELPGHTFGQQKSDAACRLTGSIYSESPLERVEIIAAGRVERSVKPQSRPLSGGGFVMRLDERIPVTGSTWVALRCFEPTGGGRSRFAHTAPWHIDIPGRPLRPRREEIGYLISRCEAEIKRNTNILPDAALAEYREALAVYRNIEKRLDASTGTGPLGGR